MFSKKVKINIAVAKESNNAEYYEPTEASLTITAKDEDTCNNIIGQIENDLEYGEGFKTKKVRSYPYNGEVDQEGNFVSKGKAKYFKYFEIVQDEVQEPQTNGHSDPYHLYP